MPDTHYVPTAHAIDVMPRRRQGRPEASTLVLTMIDNTTPQTKRKPRTRKAQPPGAANTTNRPGDDMDLERFGNDAKLWRIVRDLRAVAKEGNSHGAPYPASVKIEDDINDRREALFGELFSTPAQTVFGIAAKLHAAVWPWLTERHDQLDPPDDADDEQTRRVWEIITEAEALGRPCWTNGTSTIPALGMTFRQATERLETLIAEIDGEGDDRAAETRVEKLVADVSSMIRAIADTEPRTIGDCLAVLRVASHPTSPVRESDVCAPGTGAASLFNALLRSAALLPTLLPDAGKGASTGAKEAAQPAPHDDAGIASAFRPWIAERQRLDAAEDLHQPVDHTEYNRLSAALLTAPVRSFSGVVGKLAAALALGAEDDPDGIERRAIADARREARAIADPIEREVADLLAGGVAVLIDMANSTADSFADTVAAFEAEAPAVLSLPQAPTDAMAQAAASAAGITPEQFANAYAAAVEAFKLGRAS